MKKFPPKIEHANERRELAEYLKSLGMEIEDGKYRNVHVDYEYIHLNPDPPTELLSEPILLGFRIVIEVKY